MIQCGFQQLRAMLGDPLRVKGEAARETAQKALRVPDRMSEILSQGFGCEPLNRLERIASQHQKRVTPSARKPDPPSDIERELKALAELSERYTISIKKLWNRPEYMNLIQEEANQGWNETVESDTPFRWFPIFHETKNGVLESFDDDSRGSELTTLKNFLNRVAQRAAEAKAAPAGKRNSYHTRNEMLISSLCHLVAEVGGRKAHVLPIATVIDEWATGMPVRSSYASS